MKTIQLLNALFLCLLVMYGCRKKHEQGPQNSKVGFYSDRGCQYLFTIDIGGNDSLEPVFMGALPNGAIKFIMKEFKGGVTGKNVSYLFNGFIRPWNLPSFKLADIRPRDMMRLDHQGFLEFESAFESPKWYYSESGDRLKSYPSMYWNMYGKTGTSLGDSLGAYHSYSTGWHDRNLEVIAYQHGSFSLKDSFTYRARLFGLRNKSYLVYFRPCELNGPDSAFFSDLFIKVRDKSGLIFNHHTVSDQLTYSDDGISGKYIEMVDAGEQDPVVVFQSPIPDYNYLTVWNSISGNDFYNLVLPKNNQGIRYFFYNGCLYASDIGRNPVLTRIGKNMHGAITFEVSNIRGIFGSPHGILMAIGNDKKGLDIVKLMQ